MSTEARPVAFGQFGGLRLDVPIDEVPATQAIIMLDVDFEGGDGSLRPRDGAVKFNASEGAAAYKALWRSSDASMLALREKTFVALNSEGKEAVKATELASVPTIVDYANLGTPSASNSYIATGVATLKFNGSAFSTPTATVDGTASKAMPVGRYLASWPAGGNRLVVAGTGATGGPAGAASSNSHVWFSEPGNAEAYESTAFDQILPGDGEEITGCVEWNGLIFVPKRTRLSVYYGVDVDEEGRPIFRRRDIALPSPHFGGNSNGGQRIVATSDGVFLVCQDGVYLTTGSTPVKVSQAMTALDTPLPIQGPLSVATGFGTLRWLDFTQLYYFRRRLYLVASPTRTLIYDIERGAWILWTTNLTSMSPWNANGGGPDYLYFTSGKNVYRLDSTAPTDPTVTTVPFWQSGYYNLGSDDEKTIVSTKLSGSGEVLFDLARDFGPNLLSTVKFDDHVGTWMHQAVSQKSMTGVVFSHGIFLKPGSRVQRVVHYVREARVSRTKTGTE